MEAIVAAKTSQTAVGSGLLWKVLRILLAIALTAISASCLLKYMWWTACYSAWSGISKLAAQRRLAGANASFNGWGFIFLEFVALVTLYNLTQFRALSGLTRIAARFTVSLLLMAAATAAFALLLSAAQVGVR